MLVPVVRFENNDRAAHAVKRYVNALPFPRRDSTLRPYNMYEPAFTVWWLVPSTKVPAHRFSKLCFLRYESDFLFTGLYIEKGRDPELAGVVKATKILRSNWYWHTFLEAAHRDAFAEPIKTILKRSGCSVFVTVDLHPFGGDHERVEFAVRTPGVSLENVEGSSGILRELADSVDLPDLAQRLDGLAGEEIFRRGWVDVAMGIRLRYGNAELGAWGAHELWYNALEPWMPWVG
jgi:hypothetical protein